MSIGPGIGTLIGLKMGQDRNDEEFFNEKTRLLRQLGEQNDQYLAELAQKDAMKAVVGAVVDELGNPAGGRRLSDPANTQARGEDFIDTAEHQLNRFSSGRLSFSRSTFIKAKSGKIEPHNLVKGGPDAVTVDRSSTSKPPRV